jgi:hypothetical protein
MLDGIAIGGPRDGVKLSAGESWNGRVPMPRPDTATSVSTVRWYPGRYIWSVRRATWLWEVIPEPKAPTKSLFGNTQNPQRFQQR